MSWRVLGVFAVSLAVCGGALGAGAAARADWGVTIGKPASTVRATKTFSLLIETAPADGNGESYNATLTLTPTAALRIVSWNAGNGIPLPCTRAGRAVKCQQRSIGDLASTSLALLTLRASKAGRHSLAARLEIAGDTNAANNVARRTFTAKPAPPR